MYLFNCVILNFKFHMFQLDLKGRNFDPKNKNPNIYF